MFVRLPPSVFSWQSAVALLAAVPILVGCGDDTGGASAPEAPDASTGAAGAGAPAGPTGLLDGGGPALPTGAAVTPDAGTPVTDAGPPLDGGTVTDGGVFRDAGFPPDAGAQGDGGKPPPPCSDDCDCPSGERCKNSACVPDPDCKFGDLGCLCRDLEASTDCDIGLVCYPAAERCGGTAGTCGEDPCAFSHVFNDCTPECGCWPPCTADSDCGSALCDNGVCTYGPPFHEDAHLDMPTGCTVVSRRTVLTPGTETSLEAVQHNGETRAPFTWVSDAPAVAFANAGRGAVRAQSAGRATFTAVLDIPAVQSPVEDHGPLHLDCEGAVEIRVVEPPASGVTIAVLDADSGAPIPGAAVTIGPHACAADADGIAHCEGDGTMTLAAVAPDYGGVTILGGVGKPALATAVVHLWREDAGTAAGFHGTPTFPADYVGEIVGGVAGLSNPMGWLDFSFPNFFSPLTKQQVVCSKFAPLELPGLWPAGWFAESPGLCEQGKPGYAPRGRGGLRAAWAAGRKFPLAEANGFLNLMSTAGPAIFGDIGPLLRVVDRLQLSHAVEPVLPAAALESPGVASVGPPVDLRIGALGSAAALVAVPALPVLGAVPADAVMVSVSYAADRQGMIPLGYAFSFDDPDPATGEPDGLVDPHLGEDGSPLFPPGWAMVTFAPQLAYINHPYTVAAVAFHVGGTTLETPALNISLLMGELGAVPDDVAFSEPGFLPTGDDASYNPDSRWLTLGASAAAAEWVRVSVSREGRSWAIYAPSTQTHIQFPEAAVSLGADEPGAWRLEYFRGVAPPAALIAPGAPVHLANLPLRVRAYSSYAPRAR